MGTVYENELLGYFLRPAGGDKVAVSKELGTERLAILCNALAETLLTESEKSASLVEVEMVKIKDATSFKSVLFRKGRTTQSREIVAFSFKDAFSETALPLLGILIAIFSGPLAWASVPAILGVMRTLWKKLVVLRGPKDEHAIRLLETLARAGAADLVASRPASPLLESLVAASGLSSTDALKALERLLAKEVVEIASWGGQAGDIGNTQNRLRVRL